MLNKFQLSANTLLTYLTRVEEHYRHVPYHNHVHAADVTQSMHSLLSIPALQVRQTQVGPELNQYGRASPDTFSVFLINHRAFLKAVYVTVKL